jgi:hypothetical protein
MSTPLKHPDALNNTTTNRGKEESLSTLTAATPLTDLLSHASLSFVEQIPGPFMCKEDEKKTKKEKKKKKKKDKENQSSRTKEDQIGNKSPSSSESSLDSAALEKLKDYLIQYLSQRTDQECKPENLQMLLDPDIVGYLSQQLLLETELILHDECSVKSDLTEVTGIFRDLDSRTAIQTDKGDNNEQYDIHHEEAMGNYSESTADQSSRTGQSFHSNESSTSMASSCEKVYLSPQSYSNPIILQSSFLGTNPRRSSIRQLKFSSVSVRSYERILTIHPSTSQGPSIGIGWNYQSQPTVSLDTYESIHKSQNNQLRSSSHCSTASSSSSSSSSSSLPCRILSHQERMELLRQIGFTESQIANGVRTNTKLKHQRAQSIRTIGSFQLHSLFGRMLKRGKKSKRGEKPMNIR